MHGTLATVAGLLAACAPASHVLTGMARPAILPAQVTIYSAAPPVFEEIAILFASDKRLFSAGGEHATDKVAERLKAEAARLGANGILIEGFDQTQTLSLGGGAGSQSYSAHGTVDLNVGGAIGVFKTTAKGRAIYVPAH
jgi:hypothetical protein